MPKAPKSRSKRRVRLLHPAHSVTRLIQPIIVTGAKVLIVESQLEEEQDCKKIIDEHLKAFGTINILVNNASKQMCVTL
jgi:NAD(P)-dependent dehydrogenase (short-subunit alcohol dehydrogenase family)